MATGVRGFEAVVLAAGAGRRFGGRKLLASYGDGLLLDGALAAAFAAPVSRVLLVVGADAEAVEHAALAWAGRNGRDGRLSIVQAPDHAQGMGASLRRGAAAAAGAEGLFVFLGDMPRVPHGVLTTLAQAVRAGAAAAAPVFQGRRGNPVLLGAALLPLLDTLQGDAGARAILQTLGPDLALVESPDDGVLFDVDTPGDLAGG